MSVSTNRKMVMFIYNDLIITRFFLAIGTSYGFSERGFDNETCNSTGVYNKGHAQTSLCAQDCVFSV